MSHGHREKEVRSRLGIQSFPVDMTFAYYDIFCNANGKPSNNIADSLCDTFANPQGCHIIHGALYRLICDQKVGETCESGENGSVDLNFECGAAANRLFARKYRSTHVGRQKVKK